MLAALSRDIDAHGGEHAVQTVVDRLPHLRGGPASHGVSHRFTGAAADDDDLTPVQPGGRRQLLCRLGGILLYLNQYGLILRFMGSTCHS